MQKLILMILCFLAFGCAPAVYYFTDEDKADFLATLPKPNENGGTICLFRRNSFPYFTSNFLLSVNNNKVFDVTYGSYYCGTFPAGENLISVAGDKSFKPADIVAILKKENLLIYEISAQSKVLSINLVPDDYGLQQILGIREANDVFYNIMNDNYNPSNIFLGLSDDY